MSAKQNEAKVDQAPAREGHAELAAVGNARSASEQPAGPGSQNFDLIKHIPVSVKIVLGSATMPVGSLAKLGRGALIPLDRGVGEPVDVVVNGRTIARGEVVVMDEVNLRFGISLTEIVMTGPRG